MAELLYYIAEYSDETMPCAPDLASWAEWLAKPAAEVADDWPRDEIPSGSTFRASVLERLDNFEATRSEDGWTYSREAEADADFIAVAYGGGGWDVESIADDLTAFCDGQADSDWIAPGEAVTVAVCRSRPDVTLLFERTPDGPRCTVVGAVQ